MIESTNPLIGTSARETVENVAEALSAAVVLMADKHSALVRLLSPVLDALENSADDRESIENATEAFSAAIVLMADKHSDLCRLLFPILHALEHTTEGGHQPQADAGCADPVAEYNRRAAMLSSECAA